MSGNLNPNVVVLLASYNGEKYIYNQLMSIENQSYKNIEIIVSDDSSTDRTCRIVQDIQKNYDNIRLIHNKNGGTPRKNFNNLIDYALKTYYQTSDKYYYMFSDQDDIWHSNKVEIEVNKMLDLEKMVGQGVPCLVYSNLLKIDEKISEKMIRPISAKETKFSRIVMQNWIYGCTTLINHSLLYKAGICPECVPNHDEWISEVASLTGKIQYLDEATIDHIIHEDNATTNRETKKPINRIRRASNRLTPKARMRYRVDQYKLINELLRVTGENKIAREELERYRKLLDSRGIRTLFLMNKYDYKALNWIQNFIYWILLGF